MTGSRGFTLIELLVVIAIIGLLSSVVLSSLQSARQKAQDSRRISDLREIQKALELYYDDHGVYPLVSGFKGECAGWGGLASDAVIPGLVPNYIPELPSDPQMNATANQNCYLYGSPNSGKDYKLIDYNLTVTDVTTRYTLMDPARNFGLTRPPGCSGTNVSHTWAVYSGDIGMCY